MSIEAVEVIMDNYIIAWYLRQIATLKELQGETNFKVIAYRKAANVIEGLTESIRTMSQAKRAAISGVGPKILKMIEEYLATGTIQKYHRLRTVIPEDLQIMLKIHGLGAKTIRKLHDQLGITTIDQLGAAAKGRKIRKLHGFGGKLEMRILTGIEGLNTPPEAYTLGTVLPYARSLVVTLEQQPMIAKAALAGEIRRMKESIRIIDIVIGISEATDIINIRQAIKKMPMVEKIIAEDENELIVMLEYSILIPVRFILCKIDSFASVLHQQTGSAEYVEFIGRMANEKQIMLNSNWETEDQLFEALGLNFVPPEVREATFLEHIENNDLPKLIELKDIKGDLHMHSEYSDGIHSIEEMAISARKLGYEYIAITDHSESLKVARGLTIERWYQQRNEILVLNDRWDDFTIFTGTETDILTDATLDFEEEFLADVDVVVASIHSGFQQDRKSQTDKIKAALSCPYVDIIAHPTGRMIGKRTGYELDLELIFQNAKSTNTCLEINSTHNRMDLNAEHARKAVKEYGATICINTDAHERESLIDMELGVSVARRAGLEAKDILNTKNKQELVQYIRRNH